MYVMDCLNQNLPLFRDHRSAWSQLKPLNYTKGNVLLVHGYRTAHGAIIDGYAAVAE
jgi:hypothetical protein